MSWSVWAAEEVDEFSDGKIVWEVPNNLSVS